MSLRFRTIGLLALALLLAVVLSNAFNVASAEDSQKRLALIHGMIIDGNGGPPIKNGAVLIENGIITAVGEMDKIAISEDMRIIDVEGRTILPGFINAHVHEAFDEKKLEAWAYEGVTTVRDMANDGNLREIFAFRDRVLQNPKLARLVAAGPMVTVEDGYPVSYWGGGAVIVQSPDDAKKKVNELIDAGADLIKIPLETGGIFGLIGIASWPTLSHEEAAAIVQIAHQRNIRVSVHVTSSDQLSRALNAGVDDIAHMVTNEVKETVIMRMVKQNVYWIPTFELIYGTRPPGTLNLCYQNLRRFNEAGGKVALGTDFAGERMHFQLGMPMIEMEQMSLAGMTPMQIIVAATKNAAYVCNREKLLGTLEQGKAADILVVDGDPLTDLKSLSRIKYVLHSGVVIRGD